MIYKYLTRIQSHTSNTHTDTTLPATVHYQLKHTHTHTHTNTHTHALKDHYKSQPHHHNNRTHSRTQSPLQIRHTHTLKDILPFSSIVFPLRRLPLQPPTAGE